MAAGRAGSGQGGASRPLRGGLWRACGGRRWSQGACVAAADARRPPLRSAPPPQGHIVAASPTFSHRLPYVFKDADEFQPDRFAGERPTH